MRGRRAKDPSKPPVEKGAYTEMILAIRAITGVHEDDIRIVLAYFFKMLVENIKKDVSIMIPGFGRFKLRIYRSRAFYDFKSNDGTYKVSNPKKQIIFSATKKVEEFLNEDRESGDISEDIESE